MVGVVEVHPQEEGPRAIARGEPRERQVGGFPRRSLDAARLAAARAGLRARVDVEALVEAEARVEHVARHERGGPVALAREDLRQCPGSLRKHLLEIVAQAVPRRDLSGQEARVRRSRVGSSGDRLLEAHGVGGERVEVGRAAGTSIASEQVGARRVEGQQEDVARRVGPAAGQGRGGGHADEQVRNRRRALLPIEAGEAEANRAEERQRPALEAQELVGEQEPVFCDFQRGPRAGIRRRELSQRPGGALTAQNWK
jgi:hypothetical protein